MGTVTTGQMQKLLWPGLNSIFGHDYDEHPLECKELFEQRTSDKAWEEVQQLMTFGLAAVKSQGQSITYDDWTQTYLTRFTHVVYGLGCIITREALEDDQYDVARVISGKGSEGVLGLGASLRQTEETIAALIFDRAFNSSFVGGDGKEMCATDHPLAGGGTGRNEPTSALDLSEAALEQAYIDISKYTDDRSKKIKVMPRKLAVPTDLAFRAERILKSVLRVDTANNDLNALKSMNVFPEGVMLSHYFTDTDAWFILTDCRNGLLKFEKRAPEFQSDNEFDTENAKFKATQRYSYGWAEWRKIYGSPGV